MTTLMSRILEEEPKETAYRPLIRAWWLLVSCVLLQACATTSRNASSFRYVDSPSATCRHSLSGCVALYGKEVASTTAVLKVALNVADKAAIDQTLAECADLARSEVLLRHQGDFEELSPNIDECNELAKNARRRGMTWAMLLGVEMHEEALKCAGERLGKLRPGRFSLEQRYRYDSREGRWKLVSREEERLLEETGNGGELLGSLQPDVVIHEGDPLMVQEVYDFKFPCVNTDDIPPWTRYPRGHPHAGLDQGKMYGRVLAENPARVAPRLGVIRPQ
jgi:hypothetical protein